MTMPIKHIPTERDEQIALVEYLNYMKIPHFRVPNETYTKSWNQKRLNKALGVQSGVPDLFAIVDDVLIAIELKRTKGSVTSQAQMDWIKLLQRAAIPAKICYGCEDAIKFIEKVKRGEP